MKRPHSGISGVVAVSSSGEKEMDNICADDGELQEETAAAGGGKKKRRLTMEQVRALDKHFEVENKLDPERKVRLAHELGLKPRQVAVWFQNRRARWKTKQLERDYAALLCTYDALRFDYDTLLREKESLISEIKELKAKLEEAEAENKVAVSVEAEEVAAAALEEPPPALICKGGSSVDSDSSAILNDETRSVVASGFGDSSTSFLAESSPPFMVNLDENASEGGGSGWLCEQQRRQHVLGMEEREFLSGEEPSIGLFSDEPPAELNWYFSDHWNLE